MTGTRPPPHPGRAWFAEIGDQLGTSYLRYSHTKGTRQEVDFLLDVLDLSDGARVLDVGCGPGRHALELAAAGFQVTGVDASARFLEIAASTARERGLSGERVAFFECDARAMPFEDEFDAVLSLQGAFGLMGSDDSLVLRRMFESARPGGRVVVTAFNAYFEARNPRPEAVLDPDLGVVYERTRIKEEDGAERDVGMWTGVYTPRELRLLSLGVGLVPDAVWSVEPGSYDRRPVEVEVPEVLLLATKPGP